MRGLPQPQSKSDGEGYYVIHKGIRFSECPHGVARPGTMDSWKLVRFMRHLANLNADEITVD